jgi:hypothetical protein
VTRVRLTAGVSTVAVIGTVVSVRPHKAGVESVFAVTGMVVSECDLLAFFALPVAAAVPARTAHLP